MKTITTICDLCNNEIKGASVETLIMQGSKQYDFHPSCASIVQQVLVKAFKTYQMDWHQKQAKFAAAIEQDDTPQ